LPKMKYQSKCYSTSKANIHCNGIMRWPAHLYSAR
jgi:hypothetical protein